MITADALTRALGGRKAGRSWIARCPAHDDHNPSLSISVGDKGKILVCCHAGCDQRQVISALRSRGLWGDIEYHHQRASRPKTRRAITEPAHRDDGKRTAAALRLWAAAAPVPDTMVKLYLQSRGLSLPPVQTLRFHAGLKHHTGGVWPALVSLVTRGLDDTPLAIHRTYLARDGAGKAPIEPNKMMLGPCRGGAVRLGMPGDLLMVGEGLETCLAAMQATGHPAWAALSTSGLRTLDLPGIIREVIVLADGDDPGDAAATDAALRWKQEGRHVRIARPGQGLDFNDLLLGRTSGHKGAAT